MSISRKTAAARSCEKGRHACDKFISTVSVKSSIDSRKASNTATECRKLHTLRKEDVRK